MIFSTRNKKLNCPHCDGDLSTISRESDYRRAAWFIPVFILASWPLFSLTFFRPLSSEDLSISEYKTQVVDGKLEVLGVVANSSGNEWRSVKIEAENYDLEGKFIGEDSQYLSSNFLPSEKENFKVAFRDLPADISPENLKAKFKLSGGHTN